MNFKKYALHLLVSALVFPVIEIIAEELSLSPENPLTSGNLSISTERISVTPSAKSLSTQSSGLLVAIPAPQTMEVSQAMSAMAPGSFFNASTVIDELAYALEYNPTNIYEFVRNNIRSELYAGHKRSADRVIQDGAGNDCDQAGLLIALLRASGFDAAYRVGAVNFPVFGNNGLNLSSMLGVDNQQDAIVLMAGNNLPIYSGSGDSIDNQLYTWVVMTNGTDIVELDPFFKPSSFFDGIDVGTWSSYARSNLYAAAGGTIGSNQVSNLDSDEVADYLTELTANLCAEFREQIPNGSVEDILKTEAIIPQSGFGSLGFSVHWVDGDYGNASDYSWGSDFGIYVNGGWNYKSMVEIGTRTVSVEIDSFGYGQVLLDNDVWLQGSIGGYLSGSYVIPVYIDTITFSFNGSRYDWDYVPHTENYAGAFSSKYAFPINMNHHGSHNAVKRTAERLSENLAGISTGDETLLSLHDVGAGYFHQRGMFRRLADGRYGKVAHQLYEIGAFIQTASSQTLCDIAHGGNVGYSDLSFVDESRERGWSEGLTDSALEHGVWEQNQPGWLGVSSVRSIAEHSRGAGSVFRVTGDNYSVIEPQLSGYTQDQLTEFQNILSDTNTFLILPDSPVDVGNWNGMAYLEVDTDGNVISIINKANGGTSDQPTQIGPTIVNAQNLADSKQPSNITTPKGADPVDMATGSYLLDKVDLTMDGPMPLVMKRSYTSGSASSKTMMGYGWNHSFNMYAQKHSAPADLLGRSLEDMAGAVVAYHAMLDILESEDTAHSWAVANLVAEWMVDRIAGTAVTVYTGQKATTFIQQPDGSYTPPEGMTVSLIETNEAYVMQQRHGSTYAFGTNGLVETISDPYNNTLTFDYTGGTNLNWVQSNFGPKFTFGYNASNLLETVTDNSASPRTVEYQYDTNSNLTNVIDVAGHDWSLGYDESHQITWVKDPEDITIVQNSYNSAGQVTNQISATQHAYKTYFAGSYSIEENPFGYQTKYYFDGKGRTWSTQKADGTRTYTFFDGQNHVTNSVNAAGVTNIFVYDVDHNLLAQTNALGTAEQVSTHYGYDAQYHLRFVTNAVSTTEQTVTEFEYYDEHAVDYMKVAKETADEVTTDYTYNSEGLLQQLSEGNGKRISVYSNFDSYGNARTVNSTHAGTVNLAFDIQGNLKSTTVDGKTATFGYDARRLLVATTNGLGSASQIVTSKTYYDNGLLKTATDARDETARFYWIPAYKQAGVVFPNTGSTTNLYDDADRLVMSRDAEGNWATNTFDAVGRPVFVASAHSSVTNQFDVVGNLTNSVVDPSGLSLWKTTKYDSLNRPTSATSALSADTFQYDALSRITNSINTASKDWKTEYDDLGRVKKTFRPSGSFEETGYDWLGNRTVFWNAEGNPITFGVDAQERVTSITNAINDVTSFGYNPDGTLDWRINGELEQTDYDYDNLNRLTNVVHEGVQKAAFKHDPNGNLVEQTLLSAQTQLGYDEMNRLTASTQSVYSVSSVVQNQYDLNGNRTNIVYPGGLTVGYEFGADNRLESVTTKYTNDTETISFGYDTATRLNGISYPNGINSTFGHDAAGRITNIVHGTFVNRTIQRNALGFKETELIDAGIQPSPQKTRRSIKTHNIADQLTSERVQTDGTNWTDIVYYYNDNGGLEDIVAPDSGSVSYTYDYDNRLTSVDDASSFVEYLYDASGARVGRIDGALTNYFVIDYADGLNRPLAETDDSGNIIRYYVWSGSQLLCHIEADGTTRYYHADELGSTLALTDETGAVTDEFAYMPYGYATHTAHAGSADTPFQWLGGYGVYYDADTDLHLTLHRAYSSSMKRFISADPLGIDGGVNVYMWANMNPLAFVDPYGLCGVDTSEMGVFESLNFVTQEGTKYGWPYAHVLMNAIYTQNKSPEFAKTMSLGKEFLDLGLGVADNFIGDSFGEELGDKLKNGRLSAFQEIDWEMNSIGREIPDNVTPLEWAEPYKNTPEGAPNPYINSDNGDFLLDEFGFGF